MLGDILLDVRGIHLSLGGARILEDVSFVVRDRVRPNKITGQVVGLLGPSGVGKTRLMRIIAGLDLPDKGLIVGKGEAPLDPSRIGYVFQSYPLLRHRTVLSNLAIAAGASGFSQRRAHERATELLEKFRLGHLASRYPIQLSGGQRQRVAIAQQLVSQKLLLLMDEPFSGLDPLALEDVMNLLNEVVHLDELSTIVLVTHDIRAALTICDTVFMLGLRKSDAGGRGGAHVVETYDLVEEGLAWRQNVEADPKFSALEHAMRDKFRAL